jgi:hypothetical protein
VNPVLLRAAPWRALTGLSGAAGALALVGLLVGGAPGLRVLQLGAVLIGGAAACALDEAAAEVVEACPARRWSRVAVRASAAAVPSLVGAVVLLLRSASPLGFAQLLGCFFLGFVLAVLARTRLDEPAEVVAPATVLGLLLVMFAEPVARRVVLFPSEGGAARGLATWEAMAGACALALLAVVPERRWRH